MNGFVLESPAAKGTTKRTAFTLVELLVVIVIIAILIALLIPAVNGVLYSTRNAAMAFEVNSLAQAIEAYRSQYGDYPPDFAFVEDIKDKQQLDAHLARQFRYRQANAQPPQGDQIPVALTADLLPDGVVDTATSAWNLDPSEALVFWLRGFSPNQKRPLTGAGDRTPLFEFDQKRLQDADGDGFQEYYPQYSEQPYVYLHNSNYVYTTANAIPISTNQSVKPYTREFPPVASNPETFVESGKFQIICAGQDGKFGGEGGNYPEGLGYSDADEDNIANFSEGKTLEEAIP